MSLFTSQHFVPALTGLLFSAILLAPQAHAQDLALSEVVAPVSGCALGSSEGVRMRITNFGPSLPAGTTVLVLYSLDGGAAVNDVVLLDSTLPSHASLIHTFGVPADLSTPGAHVFTLAINPAGDLNPGNNTLTGYSVVHTSPTVAGTLAGPASAASGTLTLSGRLGTVVQWEESPDLLRWFKLSNSNSTQAFADLRTTTHFRVRVANAPCAPALSNVLTVVP